MNVEGFFIGGTLAEMQSWPPGRGNGSSSRAHTLLLSFCLSKMKKYHVNKFDVLLCRGRQSYQRILSHSEKNPIMQRYYIIVAKLNAFPLRLNVALMLVVLHNMSFIKWMLSSNLTRKPPPMESINRGSSSGYGRALDIHISLGWLSVYKYM